MFSAIAVVAGKWFTVFVVALRTLPVEDMLGLFARLLGVHVANPLLNALQMHRNAAPDTCPHPLLPVDVLRTDQAVLPGATLTLVQSWSPLCLASRLVSPLMSFLLASHLVSSLMSFLLALVLLLAHVLILAHVLRFVCLETLSWLCYLLLVSLLLLLLR